MKLSEYLAKSNFSQVALGRLLGVTQSAVSQWLDRGIVPAEHCPRIEKHFNGGIRCEDLNDKVDWAYLRTTATSPTTGIAEADCHGAHHTHRAGQRRTEERRGVDRRAEENQNHT